MAKTSVRAEIDKLILTTCNPFYIKQLWKILKSNRVQVHEEHTVWFDPQTLGRLLGITGWAVERLCWIRPRRRQGLLKVWPAWLRSYFCPNFLIVARPEEDWPGSAEPWATVTFPPPSWPPLSRAA